ncbi:MAG: VTT domain-containing protein [Planctomycetota bacterium]|nr:VTT domain-containing protein [Planctomycetota bacterium]MDA1163283.1 VTT domain-containing protein [Planctomycetota bacterium]
MSENETATPATRQRNRGVLTLLLCGLLTIALVVVLQSWRSEGIVFNLLRQNQTAAWKVQHLQTYFESWGTLAPIVYVAFVTVEVVVAPLPGLMLYAPGGVVFGGFLGGLLALIGNVLGAGIACSITKTIGASWLTRLCSDEALNKVQTEIDRRGGWLIFLLRVNPLTSSDLVSYAAGFTRIPIWKVMLATMVGMAPLCFAQSLLAESLLIAYPQLLYPLLIAGVGYVIAIIIVVRRLVTRLPLLTRNVAAEDRNRGI